MAKVFEITIYNRKSGKIAEIYEKEFPDQSYATSYCRGRSSGTVNAMFEEKKNRKGVIRVVPKEKNI